MHGGPVSFWPDYAIPAIELQPEARREVTIAAEATQQRISLNRDCDFCADFAVNPIMVRRLFYLIKKAMAWKMTPGSFRLSHSIIRDEAALQSLEHEWDDLFKRGAVQTPFLRYSWTRLCWDRQRAIPQTTLFVIVVRNHGRPVLIAPLVMRKEMLSFLDSVTPQYNDVLVDESDEGPRYVDHLCQILHRVHSNRRFVSDWVRDDSLLSAHLASAQQLKKAITSGAPFIVLDRFTDWKSYLHRLGKNLRHDHERQLRNLAKRGALDFRMSNDNTCRGDMAWLFAQKREWLEREGKPTKWLLAPATEELFTAAAKRGICSGQTWLTVLSVDGETIAAMLSFREGSTLYVSKTAYDPAWRVYSPSRTLLLLTLERAFQEGLSKIDLMIGRSPWKEKLATGTIKMRNRAIRLSRHHRPAH